MKRFKKYLTGNNGKALIKAAYANDIEMIIKLLSYENTDINYVDPNTEYTTLDIAIYNKNIDIVKLLLSRKDLNVNTTGYNSISPLSEAIINGSNDIAKLLLERDDLDVRHGVPILYAVLWNRAEMFCLLLDKDVDLNVTRSENEDIIYLSTVENWHYDRSLILRQYHKPEIQRKILMKEPSFIKLFKKNEIKLHPTIKKEFKHLECVLDLGII